MSVPFPIVGSLAAALAALLHAMACSVPDRAQWPRAYVLASEGAAPFVGPDAVDYYAKHDGTVFEARLVPEGQIVELLASGARADVVLVLEEATFRELARRDLIAPPPWRFMLRRDVLAVFTRADSPLAIQTLDDLLGDAVSAVAIEDTQPPALGGITMDGLRSVGLWEAIKPKLRREATPADVRRAVASGRAPVGIAPLQTVRSWRGSWRIGPRIDPYPRDPATFYGAVVAATPQPEAARRLWNHLERQMRLSTFLLLAEPPPEAPAASPW